MEEENKISNKNKTKSSEVRKTKKTKTKAIVNDLNNDELLEQIIAKKNKKKSSANVSKSGTAVKKSTTKKRSSSTKTSKIVDKEISNDDLYEQIKAKKTSKKKSKVITKDVVTQNDEFILDQQMTLEQAENAGKLLEYNDEQEVSTTTEIQNTIESIVDSDSSRVIDNIDDKTEDIIITRELNFDADKFDIKNQDLLEELRKAIDEFDILDDIEEEKAKALKNEEKDYVDAFETKELVVTRTRSDRYKDLEDETTDDFVNLISTPKKVTKKKINKKNVALLFVCFIVAFVSIIVIGLFFSKDEGTSSVVEEPDPKEEIDLRPQLYQDCLKRSVDDKDRTDVILKAEEDLNNYIKEKYDASISYEDLSLGFKYDYNTDETYYAASTIKTLGALYIYEKASTGELSLDDTVTYTKKFKWPASAEVSKLKYGTKITLRDLVKYSITVSDNSAHQMLVSYIGRSTLKEYGKSLGASKTLSGSDNFGNINTEDAIIYIKKLNEFINNNGDLGEELKQYFISASQNGLEMTDLGIKAAHKYGQYSPYYHDVGIVYDDKPYVIVILTTEYKGDYEAKIKDIASKVYELHELYYSNREEICRIEIYGN